MKNQKLFGLIATVSLLSISPSVLAFSVVFGDRDTTNVRSGFTNSLNVNSLSTVVDNGTNFGTAPTPIETNLNSVTRSGEVNGQNFNYTIYDIDFSDTPNGIITPGIAGNDIDDLDVLQIEIPVAQGDADGTNGWWGVDDGRTGNGTSNAALFDFAGNSIGHFGVDLHDFEAGEGISPSNNTSGASGQIRVYQSGELVFSYDLTFPGVAGGGSTDNPGNLTNNDSTFPGYGNNQSMFVGVSASNPNEFFDQIVFVLGDDDVDTVGVRTSVNDGSTEQWAADGFTFGAAYDNSTAVPFNFSPTTGLCLIGGLWVGNKLKKNRD